MAHDITIRSDNTAEAAFAMTAAWHGLGNVLDHPMTSEEALREAQLDWEVVQYPMAYGTPRVIETPEGPVETLTWHETKSRLCNVRADNNRVLGTVGPDYQVVQNTEAFAFMDELLESGDMVYESAFSLRGGRQVVLLGRLPQTDWITDGDQLLRYVMLNTAHDGTSAIRFGPTSVRVVCANTQRMAIESGTVGELGIRHTGNLRDKLDRARAILQTANDTFAGYAEMSRSLAQKRLTGAEWQEYLDVVCPLPREIDPDWSELRERRTIEQRREIEQAFYAAPTCNVGDGGQTAWSAYNAVSERVDHLPRRGSSERRKAEARFNVTLYGTGHNLKRHALIAACRLAKVEPPKAVLKA